MSKRAHREELRDVLANSLLNNPIISRPLRFTPTAK